MQSQIPRFIEKAYSHKRHMPKSQHLTTRKRQRSEHNDRADVPQKRQKGLSTASFWDNLTKVWLTKRALKELDRRNTGSVQRNRTRRSHQSIPFVRPATDYLHHCGLETLKDLKAFAKHGGPDLSTIRNHPEPVHHKMSSSRSTQSQSRKRASTSISGSKPSTNTKTTGTYDRDFQQHLVDNGIYPARYTYPNGSTVAKPIGWDEINQILTQRRPSLSPSKFSEEEFERFATADAHASKEKQVSETVIPIIEGRILDGKSRSGNVPFTNLNPLTDGTLKPGNPDIFYGARPEQLTSQIREELHGYIIPSTQHDLPIIPNFFLAVKGPNGTSAVAERQACYDGALGARAMHSLRSYREHASTYDNRAYTITSIYQSGTLKMYTSHPTDCKGRLEYHLHQIKGWAMTSDADSFRRGATAFRNGRDWAREQRDSAIAEANEKARAVSLPTDAELDLESTFTSEVLAHRVIDRPTSQTSLTSTDITDSADSDTETPRTRQSKKRRI